MTALVLGKTAWHGMRDDEGFRHYDLTLRVQSAYSDGPAKVMVAGGMPIIGAPWIFGNDNDPWAFNSPYMRITPHVTDGDKNDHWLVDLKFSNRPYNRCQSTKCDDPLAEPVGVSGTFVKYSRMVTKNYLGKAILSSSFEAIPIQKDANRPTVSVHQNVAALGIDVFAQMVDTLNDAPLWGLPKRCVKMSNVSWERRYYGSCSLYYTRRFEFDVMYETFDRSDVADMGFNRLKGKYDQTTGNWVDGGYNKNKPSNFIRIKDINDENMPAMMLDNNGKVNTDPIGAPSFRPVIKLYGESNFLALGIPATL